MSAITKTFPLDFLPTDMWRYILEEEGRLFTFIMSQVCRYFHRLARDIRSKKSTVYTRRIVNPLQDYIQKNKQVPNIHSIGKYKKLSQEVLNEVRVALSEKFGETPFPDNLRLIDDGRADDDTHYAACNRIVGDDSRERWKRYIEYTGTFYWLKLRREHCDTTEFNWNILGFLSFPMDTFFVRVFTVSSSSREDGKESSPFELRWQDYYVLLIDVTMLDGWSKTPPARSLTLPMLNYERKWHPRENKLSIWIPLPVYRSTS